MAAATELRSAAESGFGRTGGEVEDALLELKDLRCRPAVVGQLDGLLRREVVVGAGEDLVEAARPGARLGLRPALRPGVRRWRAARSARQPARRR